MVDLTKKEILILILFSSFMLILGIFPNNYFLFFNFLIKNFFFFNQNLNFFLNSINIFFYEKNIFSYYILDYFFLFIFGCIALILSIFIIFLSFIVGQNFNNLQK